MRQRALGATRWLTTPALLIALVAPGMLLASASGSVGLEGAATTAAVNVVLVVALYTFIGSTGIVSFGHIGFTAIGAYAGAILASPVASKGFSLPDMPEWMIRAHLPSAAAILVGAALAAVVAALVSIPLMRVNGFIASLATFPILVVAYNVATNWTEVTGGVRGFQAAPTSTTAGVAFAWAAAAIVVAFGFRQSRLGLRLRASRADEIAARGVGVHVARDRRIAFVLSAFLAGVAGGLTALQLGVFTPSTLYLDLTFLAIVMLVVGGRNSLSGAVVGCLLISVVTYVLQQAQGGNVLGLFHFAGRSGIENAGVALVALYTLLRRPEGLMGSKEIGDLVWRIGERAWPGRAARDGPATDRRLGARRRARGARAEGAPESTEDTLTETRGR